MANSIHSLVRLLKISTDPPSTPGPSKIEIARLAWTDTSFQAANKGEVIGEWILTLLGQARKAGQDYIADPRYWSLLSEVLTTPPTAAARPTKTWVLPLLNRLQLDVIVIELLTLRSPPVFSQAQAALSVLWPLAEKKISIDALGECFRAALDACVEWESVDENLCWICSAVVNAYRNAFANAGNKRKLYTSFLTTHLSSWLSIVHKNPSISPSMTELQDHIYAAGTDTLFSLDALKQPIDTLFDTISPSSSLIPSFLIIQPKLFASFLNATHKYRSSLFVSATSLVSGKEEHRKRGMEFVAKFWALTKHSASLQELKVEKWKSVVGVFEVVERERLFVSHCFSGRDGEFQGDLALNEARDEAVGMLEMADHSSKEQVNCSTQLLDVLVRIEYDFVGSVLKRVFSALINIPPSLLNVVTSEFLTHVLEYHSKTRTVHTYALAILDAVVASSTATLSLSIARYFPLSYHLPALAHAIRTLLTPSQIMPLAGAALQAVESVWGAAGLAREKLSKKRKVTEEVDKSKGETRSSLPQAGAFSYTCRVAGTILSNLPVSAYADEGEYSLQHLWGSVGQLGWTIVWDCLGNIKMGGEYNTNTTKVKDSKKRKHVEVLDPLYTLYPQIVAAAALRFLYDIRVRVSIPLGDHDRLEERDIVILCNIAQDEASDPELVLENIRTLLWHTWHAHGHAIEQLKAQPIFSVVMDIVTSRPLTVSKWSGALAALNRDNLTLAIFYVLMDRWIDLFNALASTETLERLVALLLSASLDLHDEDVAKNSGDIYSQQEHVVVSFRSILLNLLRSAQFWELHNVRAVFLSSVLTLTSVLSSSCFPTEGVEPPLSATATQDGLIRTCRIYRLLLYVPLEYFTRSVRVELVKRAMTADIQICRMLQCASGHGSKIIRRKKSDSSAPADELENWSCRLTCVRLFLQRMLQFQSAHGFSTSFVFFNNLLEPPPCISSPSESLTGVTLELIQLHAVSIFRSREREAETAISDLVSTFTTARPFTQPSFRETWTHAIIQSSILRLIGRLTSNFDPASLSDLVKNSLKTLVAALESALSPYVRSLMEGDAVNLDQFLLNEQIDAWSQLLSLTRWLGMNPPVDSITLGLKLAASVIHAGNLAKLDSQRCLSILGLLSEELWCTPGNTHTVHLDVLVGFYVVSGDDRNSDIENAIDACIAQTSKKLSVQDFSYLLDVLVEAMEGGRLERLIRLGRIILHDAPQGTLKITQTFATRCFGLFTDREAVYKGPSHLILHCLEFIARHCSDRPTAIRSVDLGNIWSFLHKTLSGSSEHDATTVFPIFHYTVTIIGALIRLRRDLVVHTLPHLSLILCRLVMLTRKIRPQLGAKQSRLVTDTFPSWLSASQPLSSDEARGLARLFTSLTSKTVARTHVHVHTAASESQKAESLAKPFAKHASYVLVAYVDAFSDPLCIVDAETRRELEPGLFALCEIVGEHSRDSMMMSALDSGGKVIMKSLWREYEKQRYVGKG